MSNKPLFSIIIPVYNVEQYLRDCLNSVITQTYPNYEVICVNDGSTDGSLAIVRDYESKYANIVVIDSPNGGTASARNIGLDAAQGDYIWFVDSDDWIEKDALQLLDDKLTDKVLDVLCFNGELKYEEDGRIEQDFGFEDILLSGWEYYNKYALIKRKFHFVCVVLRIFRRDFLLNNNLFFEKGIAHEDNLWIPKVLYCAPSVSVIPDSLYVYRIREGSKMQATNFKQVEDTISVANKLSCFFNSINGIDKTRLYRVLATDYVYAFSANNINLYGNKDRELKMIINWEMFSTVVRTYPSRLYYYLICIHPVLYRILEGIVTNLKIFLCPIKG